MQQLERSLQFRADIEGLRGVAVLLVMLLHFKAPFVSGGFIGVDVFFVLSGYLITALIYNGVQQRKFSFAEFYNRRVKRLTPALLLVSFLSILLFGSFLLPEDFVDFMRSVREVVLFKSNVYFAEEVQDYFGAAAEEMPLLHTWSLAIEWQFYFVFPLLFVLLLKLPVKPLYSLILLALITFCYSVYASFSIETAYFSTSARAFEFLVGAIAVFITLKQSRLNHWLTYAALLSLILMSLLFSGESRYPGINAFLVSLASLVVLLFGRGNSLLCSKPLLWLGRLSYSAYLWHWPLVAFMFHQGYFTGGWLLLPLMLLTLLLSSASYALVETPVRRSTMRARWAVLLWVVLPVILVMTSFYLIRKHEGLPQRLGETEARAYTIIRQHIDPMRNLCHTFAGDDIEQCSYGVKSGAKGEALLIGDSHGAHFKQLADVLVEDAGLKGYVQTDSSCLMLSAGYQAKNNNSDSSCRDKTREMYRFIAERELDYVLISQRWAGYEKHSHPLAENQDSLQPYKEAIAKSLQLIIESGARPVIVLPIAEGDGRHLNLCFYKNIDNPSVCDIDKTESDKKLANVYKLFDQLKTDFPALIIIDPQAVQCASGRCITHHDNVPLYEDAHHIYDYGAQYIARQYIERFGNPLQD